MVEARGVEPLSGTPFTLTSTRLACGQYFGIPRPACGVEILETCGFSAIHPVPRLHAQPVKFRLPPQQASGFRRDCQLSSQCELVRVCIYFF